MGVSLGTRITFSDSYTNVGQDSNGAVGVLNGIGLTGPRFGLENPPIIITPQRRPGTGASPAAIGTEIVDLGGSTAFAVVPETGALDSNVFTNATERAHWTALRDEFGVR